jgi:hypothetical protein
VCRPMWRVRRIGLGRAVALPELDAVSSWSP